jgi:F-type H+-transporting ATPase subunit a
VGVYGEALISVSIKAETLFTIGPLQVTNSMVGAVLASLILLAAAWFFVGSARVVPTRVLTVIELPIEWMTGIVRGSTSQWGAYLAMILALFVMILVANWLGLLPGVGTIGLVHHVEGGGTELVPFIRPASADLNFTLGLALVTVVAFIYFGIRSNGILGYLKELIGQPRYMAPLMFPINVISELSRLISLSMRLFGNVFAGEVLIGTMLAITTAAVFVLPLAFFVPAIFYGLEMLFGLVQALVFALLAMTYITMAIAEHAQHGEEHGGPAEDAAVSADDAQARAPAEGAA